MSEHTSDAQPDKKLLEAAFAGLDEGIEPDLELLSERFPGREQEIHTALGMVDSYRRWLRREKSARQISSVEVLLAPDRTLGDFRVEELIGAGGMGQVFRARQESLGGREVALKVLPPAQVAKDPRFVERFRREATLASDVHHPGIAEVYGSGEEEGLLYFAMRLVEGRTVGDVLSSLAADRRLGNFRYATREYVRSVVRLVSRVASALAAIHEKGLVHRDVKPSNIILEGAGEDGYQALGGEPVLVDFGLLRPVEGAGETGSKTTLGTAAYASPESQLGQKVDPRADVFSLGVVLHDLLALTAPGERGPATAGLAEVRGRNSAVDDRLAAIVRMALEERPLRYADGAEFQHELDRYLRNEPVRALPGNPWGRSRLWIRRNPTRFAKTLGAAVLLVTLAGTGTWVGQRMIGLHGSATRLQRFERDGDLPRAANAAGSLLKGDALLPLMPWLRDDKAYARERYGQDGGILAGICAGLVRGEDECQEAHVAIQRLLLTRGEEELDEVLLRALAFEIRSGEATWRKHLAAESAAHYLLVNPIDYAETLVEGTPLWELRASVFGVIRAEQIPDADLDLHYFAISALSSIVSVQMFEELLGIFEEGDYEMCRLAAAGTKRMWWRLRVTGQLDRVPASVWVSWVLASGEAAERFPSLDPFVDYLLSELGSTLRYVAYTRHVHKTCSEDSSWGTMPSPLREQIQKIERAMDLCTQGEDPEGIPPLPGKAPSTGFACPLVNYHNSGSKDGDMFEYENLWDGDAPEIRGSAVMSKDDTLTTRGSLGFCSSPSGLSAVLAGAIVSAEWEGATLEEQSPDNRFLEFSRPGAEGLAVCCRIPPDAAGVRLFLDHGYGTRGYIPRMGRVAVRVTLSSSEHGDAPARTVSFDAPLDHQELVIGESLVDYGEAEHLYVRVQVIAATTTYRVHAVNVVFLGCDKKELPR